MRPMMSSNRNGDSQPAVPSTPMQCLPSRSSMNRLTMRSRGLQEQTLSKQISLVHAPQSSILPQALVTPLHFFPAHVVSFGGGEHSPFWQDRAPASDVWHEKPVSHAPHDTVFSHPSTTSPHVFWPHSFVQSQRWSALHACCAGHF